jgi:hypothetical protein
MSIAPGVTVDDYSLFKRKSLGTVGCYAKTQNLRGLMRKSRELRAVRKSIPTE